MKTNPRKILSQSESSLAAEEPAEQLSETLSGAYCIEHAEL